MYIVGAFGLHYNHIDGQTVKTRLFKDCVEDICKSKIQFTDTLDLKRSPCGVLFDIYRHFSKNENVFILPAKRGLKYLLPYYMYLKSKYKNDIRYIVIGGWLPSFLKSDPKIKEHCKHLDGIYVETQGMADALSDLGLKNVSILPNFRVFDSQAYDMSRAQGDCLSLVFFSRVMKEKGVEKAIEAVSAIASSKTGQKISLDIYGDIQDGYEGRFDQIVKAAPEFIRYLGELSPDPQTLYPKLSSYDAMLFPTTYGGEGFPGVIIDAYVSGLPVIASDWRYNSELILDDMTGKLFSLEAPDSLEKTILYYIKHRDELTRMRVNCKQEADKYNANHVVREFLISIGLHPD